jgi:CBS domain-containing protein
LVADINAEFLDLYNHLDEAIRERYQLEERTSSAISFLATKLDHADSAELNGLGEALDSIRQLRNTLVHVEKVEGEELVSVNPLLVEKLKQAILYVEKPPKAKDVAIAFSSLYQVGLGEKLSVVLGVMQRRGFSHVPVMEQGKLIGVFSQEVLADYLLDHLSLSLNEQTTLASLAEYLPFEKHRNERYLFLRDDVLAEEVKTAFSESKEKCGKRLGMVFLSQNGKSDENVEYALVATSFH